MADMAPPKKHKHGPPKTAKERAKAKWTPRVTLTMSEETQAQLEAIGKDRGIVGLSAVVRAIAVELFKKLK